MTSEAGDAAMRWLEAVGADVGPLLRHRAVEPFDLSVGPWTVGASAFVLDARAQGLGESVGPVAVSVVGQDPLDGDPLGVEPSTVCSRATGWRNWPGLTADGGGWMPSR